MFRHTASSGPNLEILLAKLRRIPPLNTFTLQAVTDLKWDFLESALTTTLSRIGVPQLEELATLRRKERVQERRMHVPSETIIQREKKYQDACLEFAFRIGQESGLGLKGTAGTEVVKFRGPDDALDRKACHKLLLHLATKCLDGYFHQPTKLSTPAEVCPRSTEAPVQPSPSPSQSYPPSQDYPPTHPYSPTHGQPQSQSHLQPQPGPPAQRLPMPPYPIQPPYPLQQNQQAPVPYPTQGPSYSGYPGPQNPTYTPTPYPQPSQPYAPQPGYPPQGLPSSSIAPDHPSSVSPYVTYPQSQSAPGSVDSEPNRANSGTSAKYVAPAGLPSRARRTSTGRRRVIPPFEAAAMAATAATEPQESAQPPRPSLQQQLFGGADTQPRQHVTFDHPNPARSVDAYGMRPGPVSESFDNRRVMDQATVWTGPPAPRVQQDDEAVMQLAQLRKDYALLQAELEQMKVKLQLSETKNQKLQLQYDKLKSAHAKESAAAGRRSTISKPGSGKGDDSVSDDTKSAKGPLDLFSLLGGNQSQAVSNTANMMSRTSSAEDEARRQLLLQGAAGKLSRGMDLASVKLARMESALRTVHNALEQAAFKLQTMAQSSNALERNPVDLINEAVRTMKAIGSVAKSELTMRALANSGADVSLQNGVAGLASRVADQSITGGGGDVELEEDTSEEVAAECETASFGGPGGSPDRIHSYGHKAIQYEAIERVLTQLHRRLAFSLPRLLPALIAVEASSATTSHTHPSEDPAGIYSLSSYLRHALAVLRTVVPFTSAALDLKSTPLYYPPYLKVMPAGTIGAVPGSFATKVQTEGAKSDRVRSRFQLTSLKAPLVNLVELLSAASKGQLASSLATVSPKTGAVAMKPVLLERLTNLARTHHTSALESAFVMTLERTIWAKVAIFQREYIEQALKKADELTQALRLEGFGAYRELYSVLEDTLGDVFKAHIASSPQNISSSDTLANMKLPTLTPAQSQRLLSAVLAIFPRLRMTLQSVLPGGGNGLDPHADAENSVGSTAMPLFVQRYHREMRKLWQSFAQAQRALIQKLSSNAGSSYINALETAALFIGDQNDESSVERQVESLEKESEFIVREFGPADELVPEIPLNPANPMSNDVLLPETQATLTAIDSANPDSHSKSRMTRASTVVKPPAKPVLSSRPSMSRGPDRIASSRSEWLSQQSVLEGLLQSSQNAEWSPCEDAALEPSVIAERSSQKGLLRSESKSRLTPQERTPATRADDWSNTPETEQPRLSAHMSAPASSSRLLGKAAQPARENERADDHRPFEEADMREVSSKVLKHSMTARETTTPLETRSQRRPTSANPTRSASFDAHPEERPLPGAAAYPDLDELLARRRASSRENQHSRQSPAHSMASDLPQPVNPTVEEEAGWTQEDDLDSSFLSDPRVLHRLPSRRGTLYQRSGCQDDYDEGQGY